MGIVYKHTPAMWHCIFKSKTSKQIDDVYCTQMFVSDSEYICQGCLDTDKKELRYKQAEFEIILHDFIPASNKAILE